MASGIFALLDDVAALMDDVAAMSKIATKKTAGILGDDLAVNAEKAMGFVSDREIPVIWAITKGSFLNKLIILPIVFLLNAIYPAAIIGILIIGGVYLAYEGAEKIHEFLVPHPKEVVAEQPEEITLEQVMAFEKIKISSAVRTDFILSLEIIIIAMGTVTDAPFVNQLLVVTVVALIATVGVYGIVALMIRMDDAGYKLIKKGTDKSKFLVFLGTILVKSLPIIIRMLAVLGTLALLLVAGGIFAHHIDFFHHILTSFPATLQEFLIGLGVGCMVLLFVIVFQKMKKKLSS
jgi:predicted DNA repair protein MutK